MSEPTLREYPSGVQELYRPLWPSRTLVDKVEDLTKLAATHEERLGALDAALESMATNWGTIKETLGEMKINAALLQREIVEFTKWKDDVKKGSEEWGRRAWAVLPPVIAVILSCLLTFFLNRFFSRTP